MRSSNPVLTRLDEVATRERRSGYTYPSYPSGGPGYGTPPGYGQPGPQPGYPPYAGPVAGPERAMTLDDVVVRTVGLLALTGLSGAASWLLLPAGPLMAAAVLGSVLAGLVLVLVITFARVTNPLVIGAYAVVEGVLLGVVSRIFEARFPGIVIQAVIGTFGVFAVMAVLYKSGKLRATPRFTRFVIGALIGVVALSLVNWVSAMFGHNLGLVQYGVDGKVGAVPIIFSLACIVIGALTFILDFEAVAVGVRQGLPERYAWYCAFGLLVGLIYLYWQILRLLGYLRR